MSSLLIRVDTIVNTNVKGSKVFGLAFVKVAGVTDVFTEAEVRAFVLPKLSEPETLVGSAIVQLDNVSSDGENANHSGRGDERFTGVLTKVFSNGIVDDTVTTNMADVTGTAGVDVYFLTMDGINETAVRMNLAPPPLTFTIDGNEYSRSASDPLYQITLDEDTDADLTKTPWVLVLNYVHQNALDSGDNLNVLTNTLPVQNATFKDFVVNTNVPSEYNSASWGHSGQNMFNKVCIALGSGSQSDGTDSGIEIMFRAYSNQTSSKVNFKTNRGGLIQNFRGSPEISAEQILPAGTYWPTSEYTLYNGSDTDASIKHNSIYNPQLSGNFYFRQNDYAMTNFPFYPAAPWSYKLIACNAYYGETGPSNRWLVDNHYDTGAEPASNRTIHQIWVRANKA